MTIPEELATVLVCDADTLHGAVRFAETRVSAKTLSDYLLASETLEDFLIDFPEVDRSRAEAVVQWERERLQRDLGFDQSA